MNTDFSTMPYLPSHMNGFKVDMKGINPIGSSMSKDKATLWTVLAHKHMVETVERFKWDGLPPELSSDLIERILYYRFKGALFNYNDRYYFLPFTLYGDIDVYGRYMSITPVLFTGQWKVQDGAFTKDIQFMSDVHFQAIYDKFNVNEPLKEGLNSKAVILTDSTLQISQDYTPMEYLVRPLIEQMTDILVLVNMDLINSAKVFYVVAKDADQKISIEEEFANLDAKILSGKRVVVVTSPTELTELTGNSLKDSAKYFQSYQSIDNLRKDIIGVANGGTFMKQEHTTEMETSANINSSSAVLSNALRMRQEFCDIVNETFGLNIKVSCEEFNEEPIVEAQGSQTLQQEGDE